MAARHERAQRANHEHSAIGGPPAAGRPKLLVRHPRDGAPVRFVVDQCVPAEVTTMLRERGHDVALDEGLDLGMLTDEHVLAYAAAKRAAVVTTNADFVG